MGRYITTIGLRPEVVPAYLRIKETEGNFSEWISDLIQRYDEDEETHHARIDAHKRRINAIVAEFKRLYDNNGVVRRECGKEAYKLLEMIGMGDI